MYFQCDCSIDNEGERYEPGVDVMRKARREHTCGECGRTIKRGETYEHFRGLYDGCWDTHKTCLGCKRLRDRLCPHGWQYGCLAEQIEPCIGFDYRAEPIELDD